MNKSIRIHIEPLDEGFVVTIDGKRRAMDFAQLREEMVSRIVEFVMDIDQSKLDGGITLCNGLPEEVWNQKK
jgi:hypothetical protein